MVSFSFSLICFLFFFPSSFLPSLPSFLPFFFFFHVWHQSVKIRLGADCGSDHELLIAKFRLTLKKVGKITRPFRYNQIPYDDTVEVTNSQGIRSDRSDRGPEEGGGSWHCTGSGDQDHPQEKEMQQGKMFVWGGLKNSWQEKLKTKEKRKAISIWMQSSKE